MSEAAELLEVLGVHAEAGQLVLEVDTGELTARLQRVTLAADELCEALDELPELVRHEVELAIIRAIDTSGGADGPRH